MAYDNIDMENNNNNNEEASPEETDQSAESSNRTFLIAAGILGGIALLSLICMVLYALVFLPRYKTQATAQAATVSSQNTEVARKITQTAIAAAATATPMPTATKPLSTATFTPTSVVAVPTNTPRGDPSTSLTATVGALLTQAAAATRTVVVTPTALPKTGAGDEFQLPLLVGAAILLVVVIFIARRLRTAH
jgi:LPXTG-motif cell wall-anchored protein